MTTTTDPRDWSGWSEETKGHGCYKCHMCGHESNYPLNNHDCVYKHSYEAEQRLECKIKEENS